MVRYRKFMKKEKSVAGETYSKLLREFFLEKILDDLKVESSQHYERLQEIIRIKIQIAELKRERKDLKERGASDALIKQKNDQMLRLMEGFNKQVESAKK